MPRRIGLIKTLPETYYSKFLGPKNKRIAVLGAFDTWSYMHKICIDLVSLGYTAITSRYIYMKTGKTNTGYYRVLREPENKTMNDFLKEDVLQYAGQAIIIYSIPAAHYNEADWCNYYKIKTLGIAFIREIDNVNKCKDFVVDELYDYAYCRGKEDGWSCIRKASCPFKNQGIAKNQLEYFLDNDKMKLIGIEKIEKIKDILNMYLSNTITLPHTLPFLFEFRINLTEEKYKEIKEKLDKMRSLDEEVYNSTYEYIDYYYKPNIHPIDEWFKKKRTTRIREYTLPRNNNVGVYNSELIQKEDGFICKNLFGNVKLFEGDINDAENMLLDYGMNKFLTVFKKGDYYPLNDQYKYNIYLEEIKIEDLGDVKKYGYSIEIEIWKNTLDEDITSFKQKILSQHNINELEIIEKPVQEFIYNWINEKNDY